MTPFAVETKCSCDRRYVRVEVLSGLTLINSKKSTEWLLWANNQSGTLCSKPDCEINKRKDDTVSLCYENEMDFKFITYLDNRSRSMYQSDIRRSAPGKTTKKQKLAIGKLQEYKCYFCFKDLTKEPYWFDPDERGKIANWDHLKPISKGGSHRPSNMALTCQPCNAEKSDMTEDEFWIHIGSKRSTEVSNHRDIRNQQRTKKSKI